MFKEVYTVRYKDLRRLKYQIFLKGVLVDLFKGHIRTQWGRLPLKTSTGQKPGIV